ncbi:hypothetical protein MTO98_09740 [Mucilaginibacter sp. SMC90]|uniref:hypothetical protein n=1 Tax=Mucilaginibacter sp. SMC90 TaxID=2929803 RepID=UPI001FB3CFA8|nr:hypothetical protein [Mucilaginibacter sp. SMC90]UOE51359.1 hypothetical protein MTO98_09740 [Mucilaginibacter sp. SMC90]
MEAKYVDNLVNKVKFAGFGDAFENEIRERIAKNEPSFDLHYQPNFKHNTEAVAHITWDEKRNEYYFNSYDVMLKKDGIEPIKQTVYTENPLKDAEGKWANSTITLKEAYNMMDLDAKGYGRAVLKDFVDKESKIRSESWIRFDFTRKTPGGNYPVVKRDNFPLDTQLQNSKIANMDDPIIRKNLIDKLAKGNEVNIREGDVVKGIVVNPQFQNFKTVPAFNLNVGSQKQGEENSARQSTADGTSQSQKSGTENKASQATSNEPTEQKQGQANNNTQANVNTNSNAQAGKQAQTNNQVSSGRHNMRQATNRRAGRRSGIGH